MPDSQWKTVWTASPQGPYPVGNAYAQPDLSFAVPDPETGARDQTFRMMLRPDRWGGRCRLRFTNVFGSRPLRLDGVYAGRQWAGGSIVPGTNRRVLFGGGESASVPPGGSIRSDPVSLPFAADAEAGGRLAVSFHVAEASGPMTWHAKALATSYVSAPGSGARGHEEGEDAFPFATTSWFFLHAVDMEVPAACRLVVAFGDSLTDGSNSTLNGEDRWPDLLSRRLRLLGRNDVIVVNAGIGGNEVTGPDSYNSAAPCPGGPAAAERVDRDVFELTGVDVVVWLEGINDLSHPDVEPERIWERMTATAARARRALPGVRLLVATVPSCLGSELGTHGDREQENRRLALNELIRGGGVFDAWLDFDSATASPDGGLRPEFVPAAIGGPGDRLHPNRAGYLAMASLVDPAVLLGR